jgi:hypothetical protein
MREAGPGGVSRHLSRASTRSGFPTMAGRGFSNVRERSWPKAGRPLPPVRSRGRRAAAQTRRKMGDVRLALPSSRPAGDTGMPQRFLGSRCGELCSEHPFHRVIVALHRFVKAAVSAYASSLHYRGKSFWPGVLVIVFRGSAWWLSFHTSTGFRWGQPHGGAMLQVAARAGTVGFFRFPPLHGLTGIRRLRLARQTVERLAPNSMGVGERRKLRSNLTLALAPDPPLGPLPRVALAEDEAGLSGKTNGPAGLNSIATPSVSTSMP